MRSRYLWMAYLMLGVLVLVVSGCGTPVNGGAPAPSADIANPASVYCEEQGYTVDIRIETEGGGQYGVCVFGDGSVCEEWAFYRGECDPPAAPAHQVDGYPVAYDYPADWTVEEIPAGEEMVGGMEVGHTLIFTRDTLHLLVQIKGVDEPYALGPGGRAAGDVLDEGTISFLGAELPRHALVYEGKTKSIFTGERFEDLEVYIQMDDGFDSLDYDSIELTAAEEAEMLAILASFQRAP